MISYGIMIAGRSRSTYNFLRRAGSLNLPYPCTLIEYTGRTHDTFEITSPIEKRLKMKKILEFNELLVSLQLDEMHVFKELEVQNWYQQIIGHVIYG